MFLLHDATRRSLCRWGFVAFCLLPTCGVIGWAKWLAGERHLRLHEQMLSDTIGLRVSVAEVTFPRPGVTLYRGLTIRERETGQEVARLRLLEATQCEAVVDLVASQPEVKAEYLNTIWTLVERKLRSPDSQLPTRVRLSAAEITLGLKRGAQTVIDVRGRFENTPGGAEAALTFRLAGTEMPEPIQVRLLRNRQVTPAASGFELHTFTSKLPCWLVASGWPAAEQLGPGGMFRGSIWGAETSSGWEGELAGQLTGIDLDRLVTSQFNHKLSGSAEVIVQRARFRKGRLEEGVARLSAGPGLIGRSLVESAIGNLDCSASQNPEQLPRSIPYEQFCATFTVDSRGLAISGQCAHGGPGAILVDNRGAILKTPTGLPQPVVNLVRTLVPQSAVLVPATRETGFLNNFLPVPRILPPPGAPPTLPQARARLKEAGVME